MKSDISERAPWLIRRIPAGGGMEKVQDLMEELRLHTVCQSASCPNQGECFHSGTATFLILGGVCTRGCRFCGVPKGQTVTVDPEEPANLAFAVKKLGLKHAVVTSVTRDDLLDGGAEQFAACIRAIRAMCSCTTVEVLTPDFAGNVEALRIVLEELPEVFNHNVETVPRLYSTVRPQANYRQSLEVLRQAAQAGIKRVKSGLMLGLGETEAEVFDVFQDLLSVGVNCLTVGQYLRPSREHLPVVDYVHPNQFKKLAEEAHQRGFIHVASGPLVRSSYHAGEVFGK
ncbi:MAG: lipoate synthase [Firmicutes bacterium]|nr:lipoate synthase [Bacillota bacterium]